MNTFCAKFTPLEKERLKKIFESENAVLNTAQYMYFCARGKDFNASFYESGKLVIQGKGTQRIVAKYFESDAFNSAASACNDKTQNLHSFDCRIGVDESGKGDFLGPLVIAGVVADKNNEEKFIKLGIKDSKQINDGAILKLSAHIKNNSVFDVIVINPSKYNELYASFKNLNKLLAWGHASVIENILKKTDCKNAICDKFGDERFILNALKTKGKQINLIQRTKAEEDIAVAAASILARAEFVRRMAQMSKKYDINLPKGCNESVKAASRKIIEKYGKETLKDVAKIHFKTYNEL